MKISVSVLMFISFFIALPLNATAHTTNYQTLTHQDKERFYLIRLPIRNYASTPLLPLVLVLHGGGGNALNAEEMSGFTELAKRESLVVVYPEGSGKLKHKLLTWNAGHCCGYAMQQNSDDVGFIAKLIDHLIATQNIDPKRVYVTGMSNGGMMTHRLGLELSSKITAIAPVVATVFGDERLPKNTVSALMINGALDKSVPIHGGKPGGRFPNAWDGTSLKPTLQQATFWAQSNQCNSIPITTTLNHVVHTEFQCPNNRSVQHYLVLDNGHAWPGGEKGSARGDAPSQAINATELIWTFFSNRVSPP